MPERCPCCGQNIPLKAAAIVAVWHAAPGGVKWRIGAALAGRLGQWVSIDWLVDFVYCADPDGGPLGARNAIVVAVGRLMRDLKGYRIERERFRGYRLIRLDQ